MKLEVNGQGEKIIVTADKVEITDHHLVLSDRHGIAVACFAPGTWYSCIVQDQVMPRTESFDNSEAIESAINAGLWNDDIPRDGMGRTACEAKKARNLKA